MVYMRTTSHQSNSRQTGNYNRDGYDSIANERV